MHSHSKSFVLLATSTITEYSILCSMSDSGVALRVVAAADINTTANSVYRHNFPGTRHLQRNIQSFTADELDKLQLDVLTMSPPCQPFSR